MTYRVQLVYRYLTADGFGDTAMETKTLERLHDTPLQAETFALSQMPKLNAAGANIGFFHIVDADGEPVDLEGTKLRLR